MIASERITVPVDGAAPRSARMAANVGRVCTGLVALFLAFDTALKVLKLGPAVEGTIALGYPADSVQVDRHHRARVPRPVPGAAHVGAGRPVADRVPGWRDCHPRARLQPVIHPHALPGVRGPGALGRAVPAREAAAGPRAAAALILRTWASSLATIAAQPCLLYLAAESRVDNEPAEWLDERHVESRETTDGFHVDGRVNNVALLTMREGERQEAMDGRIAISLTASCGRT